MRRVVFDRISLADAVLINEVRGDEVTVGEGAGVAYRERRVLQGTEQRSPQIDDLNTPLQQFLGLVGQQVVNPLWTGFGGMVDMHAGRRLARAACRAVLQPGYAAALQMVEDEDAAGAGDLFDDLLRLRVVDSAHLVIIPEILHCAMLLDERETLRIERHVG